MSSALENYILLFFNALRCNELEEPVKKSVRIRFLIITHHDDDVQYGTGLFGITTMNFDLISWGHGYASLLAFLDQCPLRVLVRLTGLIC